jgi:hypothetical protein
MDFEDKFARGGGKEEKKKKKKRKSGFTSILTVNYEFSSLVTGQCRMIACFDLNWGCGVVIGDWADCPFLHSQVKIVLWPR